LIPKILILTVLIIQFLLLTNLCKKIYSIDFRLKKCILIFQEEINHGEYQDIVALKNMKIPLNLYNKENSYHKIEVSYEYILRRKAESETNKTRILFRSY